MSEKSKAYGALIFICLVWGTTYMGIRLVVQSYPAFLSAGVRQVLSGLIIGGIALGVNRHADLSARNVLRQAIIGALMIAVGNGLVSWGQKSIPSGVAALVCSTMPIWAVMLNLALSKKEKVNGTILAGMLLGLIGVGLIFRSDVEKLANPQFVSGILLTLLATMGWAVGSVLSRRWNTNINAFFDAGIQVVAGGLILLVMSFLVEDYSGPFVVVPEAVWAFVYLVIFGSVLAFSFYQYALKRLPVGIVTVYAYINPLVAVIIGYFWGEGLTWWTLLSFIGIVIGVYLVNVGYRRQHAQIAAKDAADRISEEEQAVVPQPAK